jgi:uncharacterized membrane protein YphA (DoxX/SURF4 family)
MKVSEPIGTPDWAAFFVRMALGYYLFIQGYLHLSKVPQIVEQVKGFNVVPIHLAQLYGSLLPYLSFASGILLIIGYWTTLASIVSSIMIASFVYAFKDYPASILGGPPSVSMILLCSAISLLFSGSGAISLDNFKKGSSAGK